MWYLPLVDRVPDAALRAIVRSRVRRQLDTVRGAGREGQREVIELLGDGPITEATDAANRQHYEVPTRFYDLVLGPHRKYSCGYWPAGVHDLAASERAALDLVIERAGLGPDQRILELGCGWGSLTLEIAARFPTSSVLGVSNSATQREAILRAAADRGLTNVDIRTADVAVFDPGTRFDRVASVEMFEHVRNYDRLLQRVTAWLEPDGQLFLHVFAHQRYAFLFDDSERGNWMARHFFTGGVMPSRELFRSFDRDLRVDQEWWLDGTHYERTSNAWLERLDANRGEVEALFAADLGPAQARRQVVMWRLFFLAVAELFGLDRGAEYGVTHQLLTPARIPQA